MDMEALERVLVAGVRDCRRTPYNRDINRIGDVLRAMALACGTGQMEAEDERALAEATRRFMEKS